MGLRESNRSNRTGLSRETSAADAAGVTTFAYDTFGSLTNETVRSDDAPVVVTNTIERFSDTFGRDVGYALNGVRQLTLAYDPVTGRLASMLAAGSNTPFTWDYLAGTDMKSGLAYPNGLAASWTYDANGQLLQVRNAFPTNTISQYDYTYDAAGRRIDCAHSGSAFAQDDSIRYGYNARSELTNAVAEVDADYRYGYDFDDIGNRRSSLERRVQGAQYVANNLNQYTSITNISTSQLSNIPTFQPVFDVDGNQTIIKTATGTWQVTYNGENRPVRWESVSPGSNTLNPNTQTLLLMSFDRMGRRVTKNDQRFVYDGYLQIANDQLSSTNYQLFAWDPTEPVATRPLAWLRPTLNAQPSTLNFYTHDGNKNVSEVVAANGEVAAHYEYAAFGAASQMSGSLAAANPWRFSSEYAEDDTATVYYNYRHYTPSESRWFTRDWLQERGGVLLYGSLFNAPTSELHVLGLRVWTVRESGGCKFEDIDSEAKKALKLAVQKMNASQARHEWFGSICCKCEKGSYTTFRTGPFEGKKEVRKFKTNSGWVIEEQEVSPQRAPYAACPKEATLVGYYHTHPDGRNLSSADLDLTKGSGVPIYMAQGEEKVQQAVPRRTDDARRAGYSGNINMPGGIPIDPQVTTL